MKIKIDGVIHADVQSYDDAQDLGAVQGMNEATKPGDKVISFLPSGKKIWAVNCWWLDPITGRQGLKGFFKYGRWEVDSEGNPMLVVWDRLT